jgi:MYXO-CTERM domain-containing protein
VDHLRLDQDERGGRDYDGTSAAATDLAAVVAFEAGAPGSDDSIDRLRPAQPTTDRGDPGDDFTLEPTPNGGRINIGAFGNTPFAELSAEVVDGGTDGDHSPAREGAGCHCGVGHGAGGGGGVAAVGLLVALGLLLRRRR